MTSYIYIDQGIVAGVTVPEFGSYRRASNYYLHSSY